MKNPIFIGAILLLFILVMTFMNDVKEDKVDKYWEDPSVFQVNRLPARAHFYPFESKALARDNDRSKSNYFQSLNGKWKFHFSPNPKVRPKGFFQTDFSVNNWDDITVPGHWEMQGYSVPIYLDEEYPFKPDPPKVPFDYNSVGSYKRSFIIPDDWNDRDIILHFGGVRSAFYVWVNGNFIGYSQGSKTPA